MIKIELYTKALNFLKELDRTNSKRITKKIKEIKLNPERYISSLINKNYLKIRIGDYRLFVNYNEEEKKLIIYSIKHRKNAYKK